MENTIKILHLEDNPNDSLLVQSLLKTQDVKFEYHFVDNEEEYISILRNQNIDLILSDYHLPDYSGMEALRFAKIFSPEIPFVFLSGTMGEDVAVKSLLDGATDYVLKNNMERLVPAVQRAFREAGVLKTRLKAEKDLLRSEENFRSSIAESPLGIRIVTVDGETIYANKAFLDIYQFSSLEEFKNNPAKQRYSPECFIQHEERKALRQSGLDVLEYELTIIRKDGTIRYLKVSRKEVLWNGVKHFQVIKIDITEQKNTEAQLRKLSRAVEQSPDATVITNTNGIIEYVNPKTVELTGYSVDELMGQNPRILSSGEKTKEEYAKLWETIKSGNIWTGEFHNKKKSGELYWEAATISPILDNQGKITHFLAIKVNITATKKLLQDLKAAKEKAEESDRLKTAFLNNISHEIRTPFNGLLGFLSLIQDDTISPEERDKYINIINHSADRLMNTINDIVEISQIQTAQTPLTLSETKITKLAYDLYEHYKPEALKKGLRLIFNNALLETCDTVSTDSSKLNTILSHLINNAIKFTNAGSIELNIYPIDNRLEFSIKDTGICIPADRQKAIFERFIQADISNTRPFEGAGLGLSISKAFVEMLGGKIWVESQVDKGSTFYFTIPFITTQNAIANTEAPEASNVKEDLPKMKKVLIVEDDETSEMLLTMLLENYFNERLYARTGIEAIEVSRNNPDIELILMDIKMPGMDGYETTRQIRKFNPSVIIIAQTAHALAGDRERALAAGCNEYIPKPYNKTSLMKVINKALKI